MGILNFGDWMTTLLSFDAAAIANMVTGSSS